VWNANSNTHGLAKRYTYGSCYRYTYGSRYGYTYCDGNCNTDRNAFGNTNLHSGLYVHIGDRNDHTGSR
jgi:hypothetical protein